LALDSDRNIDRRNGTFPAPLTVSVYPDALKSSDAHPDPREIRTDRVVGSLWSDI